MARGRLPELNHAFRGQVFWMVLEQGKRQKLAKRTIVLQVVEVQWLVLQIRGSGVVRAAVKHGHELLGAGCSMKEGMWKRGNGRRSFYFDMTVKQWLNLWRGGTARPNERAARGQGDGDGVERAGSTPPPRTEVWVLGQSGYCQNSEAAGGMYRGPQSYRR